MKKLSVLLLILPISACLVVVDKPHCYQKPNDICRDEWVCLDEVSPPDTDCSPLLQEESRTTWCCQVSSCTQC
jgi:hypothetical protein